jgi:hypothetical protein
MTANSGVEVDSWLVQYIIYSTSVYIPSTSLGALYMAMMTMVEIISVENNARRVLRTSLD